MGLLNGAHAAVERALDAVVVEPAAGPPRPDPFDAGPPCGRLPAGPAPGRPSSTRCCSTAITGCSHARESWPAACITCHRDCASGRRARSGSWWWASRATGRPPGRGWTRSWMTCWRSSVSASRARSRTGASRPTDPPGSTPRGRPRPPPISRSSTPRKNAAARSSAVRSPRTSARWCDGPASMSAAVAVPGPGGSKVSVPSVR